MNRRKTGRGQSGTGAQAATRRVKNQGVKLSDLDAKDSRKVRGGGVTLAPIVITKPIDKISP